MLEGADEAQACARELPELMVEIGSLRQLCGREDERHCTMATPALPLASSNLLWPQAEEKCKPRLPTGLEVEQASGWFSPRQPSWLARTGTLSRLSSARRRLAEEAQARAFYSLVILTGDAR